MVPRVIVRRKEPRQPAQHRSVSSKAFVWAGRTGTAWHPASLRPLLFCSINKRSAATSWEYHGDINGIHVYVYICVCVCVYIYIHIYICVCVYVYVTYVYIYNLSNQQYYLKQWTEFGTFPKTRYLMFSWQGGTGMLPSYLGGTPGHPWRLTKGLFKNSPNHIVKYRILDVGKSFPTYIKIS